MIDLPPLPIGQPARPVPEGDAWLIQGWIDKGGKDASEARGILDRIQDYRKADGSTNLYEQELATQRKNLDGRFHFR